MAPFIYFARFTSGSTGLGRMYGMSPCLVRAIAVLETLVLTLEGFGVVCRFVFVVVLSTAEGAHMVHLLLLLDGALLRLAGLVDSP